MSFIKDQFGNQGRDLHGPGGYGTRPDGKLQSDEIDIRGQSLGAGAAALTGGGKFLSSGWDGNKLKKSDWSRTKGLGDILGEINNGRVSDISKQSTGVILPQDIVLNKDNQETSVKGIVEETALSRYFFSTMNTKVIQDIIKYRVYKKTKLTISAGNISSNELYIVMRSILLQHGNFKVSAKDIAPEIQKLNNMVARYSVDEISSNLLQYKRYKTDLERLPTPMDRPVYGGMNRPQYDSSNLMVGAYT